MTSGRRDLLLDTGPLVAVLDRGDAAHQRCVRTWEEVGSRCVTTEAVVTEATHLVCQGGGPPGIVLELLLAAEVPILGLDVAGHRLAARLMRQYQDTPMDYADATLVVAAEWLKTRSAFTLDRRGFRTYRLSPDRAFTILPAD